LRKFDIVVLGGGIAGLATALAIYKKNPKIQIALLGPDLNSQNFTSGFGSNQPAIASHPHFSTDHNLLSQWTSFCVPLVDRILEAAFIANPSLVVARGRWQIANCYEHAQKIQARIDAFNINVERQFQAEWRSKVGEFGAMWLPSAWAVSPAFLRQVWMRELSKLSCSFVEGNARMIEGDLTVKIHYDAQGKPESIHAERIVLCAPAGLHTLLEHRFEEIPISGSLPLVQWPGQTQKEESLERSTKFGAATVQDESYAIALGSNEWLVLDELETANNPFRGDRWHTPDRLPYIGSMFDSSSIADNAMKFWKNDLLKLPIRENVFLNSAHGTRGLLSGIAGGAVIADLLLGVNTLLPQTLAAALNPNRYVRRSLRQHFRNLQSTNNNL
jgi:glycine/D-amino acid oxidase-like deaminating enzyme